MFIYYRRCRSYESVLMHVVPPCWLILIYIEDLCNMDALFLAPCVFTDTYDNTRSTALTTCLSFPFFTYCTCCFFCFSRLTRTFFGQRAVRGGANGVVYMKCGGRTDWRGGGAATSATDATGLLERGAEPARRIITSLTSPGLVVGMNNIQSSLSPPSPSAGRRLEGKIPVIVL